jgi:STAM-binding protein
VTIPSAVIPSGPQPSAPDLSALDKVVYPNDFPTDPHVNLSGSAGLLLPDSTGSKAPKPSFDRSTKPSLSLIEGGLRKLCVPSDTMTKFLSVAHKNTVNNVETCGILAGQLKQHQLFVTHCILPKQSGTSDSCNTKNEEDIFIYQDQHNLITLGWIHVIFNFNGFLDF